MRNHKFDGHRIVLKPYHNEKELYLKYYFTHSDEAKFYLRELERKGWINLMTQIRPGEYIAYKVTLAGLNKHIQLTEEGARSNLCFVAMPFSAEKEHLFDDAISPACNKYGVTAIRVDRLHPQAYQTINDLIIAQIKKCKLLICDFTKQKWRVFRSRIRPRPR